MKRNKNNTTFTEIFILWSNRYLIGFDKEIVGERIKQYIETQHNALFYKYSWVLSPSSLTNLLYYNEEKIALYT